jgi:hypothetical protein
MTGPGLPRLWLTGALLVLLTVMVSCGQGGTLTGTVLDAEGEPLAPVDETDVLIVTLVCPDPAMRGECFHQQHLESMELDAIMASICDAKDRSESCIVHLGRSATPVEADGSYTLANVSPGEYDLLFVYSSSNLSPPGSGILGQVAPVMSRGWSRRIDVPAVQKNETTVYDIKVDLIGVE